MTDDLIERLQFHGRHASETERECTARKNGEREEAAGALRAKSERIVELEKEREEGNSSSVDSRAPGYMARSDTPGDLDLVLDRLFEKACEADAQAKENRPDSPARHFLVGKANAFREAGNVVLLQMSERPAESDASIPSVASAGTSATDELFALKSRIDVEGMARIVDPDVWRSFDRFPSPLNPEKVADSLTKAQALRTLILGEEVEEQYSRSSVSVPSVVASDARTETPSPAGKGEL